MIAPSTLSDVLAWMALAFLLVSGAAYLTLNIVSFIVLRRYKQR